MIKRTLLLDQDGPLTAFDDHAWQLWSHMQLDMGIGSLDAMRHRFLTDHMTREDHIAEAKRTIDTPGWFYNLPVVEGALEGVPRLMEAFDVWVCTKPKESNPTCRDDKAAWMEEHFPYLVDRLIIAPDKSMVYGEILLDDAPMLAWMPHANWRPVIFRMPWNQGGSVWADFPHWDWSDPVTQLLRY